MTFAFDFKLDGFMLAKKEDVELATTQKASKNIPLYISNTSAAFL